MYRILLSIHIIAVISWMAGILYLYRLFVYHAAETEAVVKERFKVMEERLSKIIMMPAMGIALIVGITMMTMAPGLFHQGWMHAKLFFVLILMGMTHFAIKIRKRLAAGENPYSSGRLRVLNEIPTILMIAIVFLVILQPF